MTILCIVGYLLNVLGLLGGATNTVIIDVPQKERVGKS